MRTRTTPFLDETQQSAFIVLTLVLAMLGTCAHGAAAQIRTSISGVGGISSTSSDVGGVAGGKLTFDLSPRLDVETSLIYSSQRHGASALTGEGRLLVSLLPAERRVRPFAAAGLAVYRARFDMGRMARASGRFDATTYGQMMSGIAFPAGMQSLLDSMPAFYGRRLGSMMDFEDMVRSGRETTFTDPAVSVGTGVALDAGRHVVLSPEARLLVVMRSGRSHTVGMFTLGAGYRW